MKWKQVFWFVSQASLFGKCIMIASQLLYVGFLCVLLDFTKSNICFLVNFFFWINLKYLDFERLVDSRTRAITSTLVISPKGNSGVSETFELCLFEINTVVGNEFGKMRSLAFWLLMFWWSLTWSLRCQKKPEKPMDLGLEAL